MRTRDSVSIGWCDPGVVDGHFAVALAILNSARSGKIGPLIRVEGSAMVSKMRNEIVATFLASSPSEWLLMFDSDEILPVSAFDKLIAAAHETERPVVGGLVFGSFLQGGVYPTPVPTIYRATEDNRYAPVLDYPRDTVIEVDACGTGCVLIHRTVLEAMRENASDDEGKDWCWFNDGPVGGQWVGEDMIFCRRIKQLGYPIHSHTGAHLPHRKRYWLTQDHHDHALAGGINPRT